MQDDDEAAPIGRVRVLLYLTQLDMLVVVCQGPLQGRLCHILSAEDFSIITVLQPFLAEEAIVTGCVPEHTPGRSATFYLGGEGGTVSGITLQYSTQVDEEGEISRDLVTEELFCDQASNRHQGGAELKATVGAMCAARRPEGGDEGLLAATIGVSVMVWQTPTGELLWHVPRCSVSPLIALSMCSTTGALYCSNEGMLHAWTYHVDAPPTELETTTPAPTAAARRVHWEPGFRVREEGLHGLSIVSHGALLLGTRRNGEIACWDTTTGHTTAKATIQPHGMSGRVLLCSDGVPYRHRMVALVVLDNLMAVVDYISPARLVVDYGNLLGRDLREGTAVADGGWSGQYNVVSHAAPVAVVAHKVGSEETTELTYMVPETSGMALTARGQLYIYGVRTGHTPRHMSPSFLGEAYDLRVRRQGLSNPGNMQYKPVDRRAHRVTCCGYSQRMGLCLVGWTDGLVTAHAESHGEAYAVVCSKESSPGVSLGDILMVRAWGGLDEGDTPRRGVDGEDFSGATVAVGGSEGWVAVVRCAQGGYGPRWGPGKIRFNESRHKMHARAVAELLPFTARHVRREAPPTPKDGHHVTKADVPEKGSAGGVVHGISVDQGGMLKLWCTPGLSGSGRRGPWRLHGHYQCGKGYLSATQAGVGGARVTAMCLSPEEDLIAV